MMYLILLSENFKQKIVYIGLGKPDPEVPTETSILRSAFPPPKLGDKSRIGNSAPPARHPEI
jgi:hypothetical protein